MQRLQCSTVRHCGWGGGGVCGRGRGLFEAGCLLTFLAFKSALALIGGWVLMRTNTLSHCFAILQLVHELVFFN